MASRHLSLRTFSSAPKIHETVGAFPVHGNLLARQVLAAEEVLERRLAVRRELVRRCHLLAVLPSQPVQESDSRRVLRSIPHASGDAALNEQRVGSESKRRKSRNSHGDEVAVLCPAKGGVGQEGELKPHGEQRKCYCKIVLIVYVKRLETSSGKHSLETPKARPLGSLQERKGESRRNRPPKSH